MREYYTVDRSAQEVRNLWDWAIAECHGKIINEAPYAMGVLAAMEYLMGETEERPQDYKGNFTLNNLLRLSEQADNVRHMGDSRVQEALHNNLDSLRPGNPKCLLCGAPLVVGHVAGAEGGINEGDKGC